MNQKIKSKNIINHYSNQISNFANNWDNSYAGLSNFFNDEFNISSTVDQDIID